MKDAGGRRRAPIALLLLAGMALLLPACGAGGGGGDGLPGGSQGLAGLAVATLALPAGHAGVSYPVVRLEASGTPAAALTWSLWDGDLPDGIHLDDEGRLHGTPRHAGFSTFTVCVSDGRLAGVGTLALAVDAFGLVAQSGLVAGEAWSRRPVGLRAAGQDAAVTFALSTNGSGGDLLASDPEAGTAVYRPGDGFDDVAVDVVRATDTGTGRAFDLVLTVRRDPMAGCVAEFGQTDVWYIDGRRKHGAHAFATDFQAALSTVGLRDAASTDSVGSQADHLAELWVRLEMLRKLNAYYGRNDDGSAGPTGFAVSFPFDEPGPGYVKPAPGTWIQGAAHHFSVIAMLDGTAAGVVGTAFVDDAVNTLHENDTSSGGTQLGVFVNVAAGYFATVYDHGGLADAPVDDADVPVLRALLHGLPSPGGRYAEIRDAGRDFARVLATIAAHEIGHSLGLAHTPSASGESLMAASAAIAPWSDPDFLPDDVARLEARLPGPGRFAAGVQAPVKQGVAAATLPEGGVCACDGQTCHLRLPPVDPVKPQRRLRAGAAPAPRSAPARR